MPDHHVTRVRAEFADPTAWVPTARPRLSWQTITETPGWHQTGAEITVSYSNNDASTVTAKVDGASSVFVEWPFAPLTPRERVSVRVRSAGPDGRTSAWSEPLQIQCAEVAPNGWTATPIEHPTTSDPALLRTDFTLRKPVRQAILYAAARGVYQVSINGQDVDDHVLKPGWTSFDLRLPYEATDVTSLLIDSINGIGIRLAGGWYTERYHRHEHDRPTYGDRAAVACQLVIEYDDGSSDIITTDDSWVAATGETIHSSIYLGETVDATRELQGWSEAGFDDADWAGVVTSTWPIVPTPRIGPPVRRIESLPVRSVHVSPSGVTILDFGQNLVGRLRLRVRGARGTRITLRHAEALDEGELALRPLRTATATDVYIHAGGERIWEPEFTFHGFRYASIEGIPGGVSPEDVSAVVTHSEMTKTGWFECSDPLINRLHENVVWSMRGNFLHIPTDCPQRDERQGWTGDIQVFTPTASTLFDVNGFLASWLTDLRLEQAERGAVSYIVPDIVLKARSAAAAWGDAATVVPWVLFERFADKQLLRDQFASMTAWVEQIAEAADDDLIWGRRGWQFGDWLDPSSPPDDPRLAKVPAEIVATAYFYRSAQIVADAARQLGDDAATDHYTALAAEVRRAWVKEYLEADGPRIVSDAPTAYALAIEFGIVEESALAPLGDRLAELLEENGHRVPTGFVGTPILADALTKAGRLDVAGRVLQETECPSWLYPVTMGATTVWERWDSMMPDGTINPGEMTSFNHYALGAVADWLHRTVAGLGPDAPGYARLRVAPQPIVGLDYATSTIDTPYGTAMVGWTTEYDSTVGVRALVPPNTSACVDLPGREPFVVQSGQHSWTIPDPRKAPST